MSEDSSYHELQVCKLINLLTRKKINHQNESFDYPAESNRLLIGYCSNWKKHLVDVSTYFYNEQFSLIIRKEAENILIFVSYIVNIFFFLF